MESYKYTKSVDAEVVNEAINLRTSLRSIYLGCHVHLNADGSAPEDNICLDFSRALTSSEQDEITVIINAYGPEYDLVVRKKIEKGTMTWAKAKGSEFLDQFSANNMYRQKDAATIKRLIEADKDLITSLKIGSLQTSLGYLMAKTPNADITQEEIDEFVLRMKIILGIP